MIFGIYWSVNAPQITVRARSKISANVNDSVCIEVNICCQPPKCSSGVMLQIPVVPINGHGIIILLPSIIISDDKKPPKLNVTKIASTKNRPIIFFGLKKLPIGPLYTIPIEYRARLDYAQKAISVGLC